MTPKRKPFTGNLREAILTGIAKAGAPCPPATDEWARACIRAGASPDVMAYIAVNAAHDPALIKLEPGSGRTSCRRLSLGCIRNPPLQRQRLHRRA